MLQWVKWTAKAWVAGIGTFVTTMVAQYFGELDVASIVDEVVEVGFDWSSATMRSAISGAIVWTVTYFIRNAQSKLNDD